METILADRPVAERLNRIESLLETLVEQRTVKEWYTTPEVAKLVSRSEFTVREWCRAGRVKAKKSANGRGWVISHEELQRLRNHEVAALKTR